MLERKLKHKLVETKKKQEKKLIEEQILNKRFMFIIESELGSNNFDSLSEEKQTEIAKLFFFELHRIQKYNLVSEGALADYISQGIQKIGFAGFETLAEKFVLWILTEIGMEDGFLKNFIASMISKDWRKFKDAIKDCNSFAKLIGEGLVEAFVMNLANKINMDGAVWSVLRNWLGGLLKEQNAVQKLTDELVTPLCKIFSKGLEKIKGLVS